jgi:hypothetical protein
MPHQKQKILKKEAEDEEDWGDEELDKIDEEFKKLDKEN